MCIYTFTSIDSRGNSRKSESSSTNVKHFFPAVSTLTLTAEESNSLLFSSLLSSYKVSDQGRGGGNPFAKGPGSVGPYGGQGTRQTSGGRPAKKICRPTPCNNYARSRSNSQSNKNINRNTSSQMPNPYSNNPNPCNRTDQNKDSRHGNKDYHQNQNAAGSGSGTANKQSHVNTNRNHPYDHPQIQGREGGAASGRGRGEGEDSRNICMPSSIQKSSTGTDIHTHITAFICLRIQCYDQTSINM